MLDSCDSCQAFACTQHLCQVRISRDRRKRACAHSKENHLFASTVLVSCPEFVFVCLSTMGLLLPEKSVVLPTMQVYLCVCKRERERAREKERTCMKDGVFEYVCNAYHTKMQTYIHTYLYKHKHKNSQGQTQTCSTLTRFVCLSSRNQNLPVQLLVV